MSMIVCYIRCVCMLNNSVFYFWEFQDLLLYVRDMEAKRDHTICAKIEITLFLTLIEVHKGNPQE